MLATADQLRKYLATEGIVAAGAGAGVDGDLLDLMLAGASSRITEQRPERTLEPLPALRNAGTTDAPDWVDDNDPVALSFPIHGRRLYQVPDLRAVDSIETVNRGTTAAFTGDYTLVRRPRELCALWIRFRHAVPWGDELVITGRWGPAGAKIGDDPLDVLPALRDAVLVWTSRAYHNRAARYSDTQQDPAGGIASYFRNLPPDVKLTLDALEVPGI